MIFRGKKRVSFVSSCFSFLFWWIFFCYLIAGGKKNSKKEREYLSNRTNVGGSGEQPFWVLFEEQKRGVGWKSIYHIPVIQGQKTNKMGFFASLD